MKKNFIIVMFVLTSAIQALGKMAKMDCVDYVNPLVGTESKFELSTGGKIVGIIVLLATRPETVEIVNRS